MAPVPGCRCFGFSVGPLLTGVRTNVSGTSVNIMQVGVQDFLCHDGVTRRLGYLLADDDVKYLVLREDTSVWAGGNDTAESYGESLPVELYERYQSNLDVYIVPWYEPNSNYFSPEIIPLLYQNGARFTPDEGAEYGFLGRFGLFKSDWSYSYQNKILPVSMTCYQREGEQYPQYHSLVMVDSNGNNVGVKCAYHEADHWDYVRCDLLGTPELGFSGDFVKASLLADWSHADANRGNMNLAAYNAYCLIAVGFPEEMFTTVWEYA